MSAKEIVFKVAERLPENATALDAVNLLELCLAEASAEARVLPVERESAAPAWLYESSSRLSAIMHQTRKRNCALPAVVAN